MKSLADLLPDGARVVIRPMDARIPYEHSFVIEATVKSRWPDRTWPHSGLSPRQQLHRLEVEDESARSSTLVAAYAMPGQEPGTSVLLGFVTRTAVNLVSMVYVKRDFRGYGIGAQLLGGEGSKGDVAVRLAVPLRANRCWQRWVAYHQGAS